MSIIEIVQGSWRFRDFIVASVRREFVSRYQGTQLGLFWPIAHPLALIVIYTLVFSQIMKPTLPGHDSPFAYSIYLTSGLIVWTLFSDLLGKSVGSFVLNANLIKKVSLPKYSFFIIAALSSLIQFGIIAALFLAFLLATGNFPGAPILAVVPVLAITVLFASALGVVLATVNVFYRDIEQSTTLILQFWFWLTPIVYPSRALPDFVGSILSWNPMWPIVRAVQDIFVEHRNPEWATLAYPLLLAIALIVLAGLTYSRLSSELVDEL